MSFLSMTVYFEPDKNLSNTALCIGAVAWSAGCTQHCVAKKTQVYSHCAKVNVYYIITYQTPFFYSKLIDRRASAFAGAGP